MAVTVSLGRQYARSTCSIFPLSMESYTLEESTNNSVALRFFVQTSLMIWWDCQNLRCCGLVSLKIIMIFPKNFLDFRSDTVEKQSIINFISYRSKSYTFPVLGDSEVTFFREVNGMMQPLCLFMVLQNWRSKSLNYHVFLTSGSISLRPAAFLLLIFVSSTLSSSSVNCPSLIFCWLFSVIVFL